MSLTMLLSRLRTRQANRLLTSPSWIQNPPLGPLAIAPYPAPRRWLYDVLAAWKDAGADIVVSLLSDREVSDCGLDGEKEHCRELGIEFRRFPITDHGIPDSADAFLELICELHDASSKDRGIVAHCLAGIGRSTMVAASLLVRSGLTLDEALGRISLSRGFQVPDTTDQRDWLRSLTASL